MMQELLKEEKLRVIDAILAHWERHGEESYICEGVCYEASFRVPLIYSHTDWSLIQIPELLLIKPADAPLYSVFGWFGRPKPYPERRTNALQRLRKIIEEKEL
jgi:hypothetical protein